MGKKTKKERVIGMIAMIQKLIAFCVVAMELIVFSGLRGTSPEQMKRFEMHSVDLAENERALRGADYQEYFTVYRRWFRLKAVVYNNIQATALSDSEWDAVDVKKIKKELGALVIVKNGPRFWTLDGINGYEIGERRSFLGHDFVAVAAIDVGLADLTGRDVYAVRFQGNRQEYKA